MQITWAPTSATVALSQRTFERFERLFSEGLRDIRDYAILSVEQYLADVFEAEGDMAGITSGPWAPLADATVAKRRWLMMEHKLARGVGPEHPILVRTGELRGSMTGRGVGSEQHVIETTDLGAHHVQGKVGTMNYKFELHQKGEPHMPKRPIWPEEADQPRLIEYLTVLIVPVIEDML